jgi:hypothetical protein
MLRNFEIQSTFNMSIPRLHRRSYPLPLAALSLLLVPLIAMQFSAEVNWAGGDFLVGGLLLLALGWVAALVLRYVEKRSSRAIGIALTLLVFLLVWAELAVGVFGTSFAGS